MHRLFNPCRKPKAMSEKKIDLVHRIEFTIAEHGVTSYWIAAYVGYGEDMDKWVNAYYVRELLGEAKEFERIFSQARQATKNQAQVISFLIKQRADLENKVLEIRKIINAVCDLKCEEKPVCQHQDDCAVKRCREVLK